MILHSSVFLLRRLGLLPMLIVLATAVQAEPPADFSQVPGVILVHSPASSGLYIGSPGLAVLPSGEYLAKCDLFGPSSTQNESGQTRIFHSTDRGATWAPLTEVSGLFWASLFVHRGAAYLMGTTKVGGNIVMLRSDDDGRTWTRPVDAAHGLLREGRYHCAPVPVVTHAGRLWRGMEDVEGPGRGGLGFRAFLISAPVDADLLNAESWTLSPPINGERGWLNGKFGGWLEGNAVVGPEGTMVDILRVDHRPEGGKAAIVHVSDDGTSASFAPSRDFIDFPGGNKKFTIRYDPQTRQYWSLSNWIAPRDAGGNPERTRNAMTLISSPDLQQWTVRCVVVYHPDPLRHGFQYVDWLFDGDDLIALSRTAADDGLGGAGNCHDANFLTFHRIANFRTLTLADSDPAIVDDFRPAPAGGAGGQGG